MKLKDQLILREVAGQYVIVPTGKRVREVTSVVYISSSAAYLWDYMKDHDFTKDELVDRILDHYEGVTAEKAAADIDQFLKTLADNNILDDGVVRGRTFVRIPKEVLDKLWPKGGLTARKKGRQISDFIIKGRPKKSMLFRAALFQSLSCA